MMPLLPGDEKSVIRLSDFTDVLHGERIYLRKVCPEDVEKSYYQWMNDPKVVQYTESRFSKHSKSALIEYVREHTTSSETILFAIVLQKQDRHIGNIKLGPVNRIHRLAEVGIILGEKDCWGKGYGAEAITVLAEWAFASLKLHKLTAGCYAPNEGAVKAFQKGGFQIEGIRKNHCYCNGEYVDTVLLGRISAITENLHGF